jgi:hypothetical protein
MRVFDTFPEGVAFIQQSQIISHNKALREILQLDRQHQLPTDDVHFATNENFLATKRGSGEDLHISRVLMQTPIKPLVQQSKTASSTVWQFLAKN